MIQSTSLQSYKEVKPTLGERQSQVLSLLRERGASLTNSEIADRLGWSINRVTPRVFELRELGLVVEDGKRTCDITGRQAIAWRVATPPERKELWRQLRLL